MYICCFLDMPSFDVNFEDPLVISEYNKVDIPTVVEVKFIQNS